MNKGEEGQIARQLEKEDKTLKDLNEGIARLNRRLSPWRSFLNGILVALGSTIGFAIAFTVITYILRALQIIPGTEGFFGTALDFLRGARE